jgi:phospholipid/cholesterol/gamma-HCH transport system substrate-binding protein
MSRKTEIQVGLTVLIAIGVLLWGIAWLGRSVRSMGQQTWHVSFRNASGLAEGNEAQVNGVKNGSVGKLRLLGDHVMVDLLLSKDIRMTKRSQVVIRNVGLMGDKVIAVDYDPTGEPWSPADTLPGEVEKGLPEVMAELGGATGGITALSAQLDSIAVAMNEGGGMRTTVHNLRRTAESLNALIEDNRAALRTTLANFAATSQTTRSLLQGREAKLREALDHFEHSAENLDRLTSRLDSLRASVQNTASRLDRGEGTLGKLMSDDKLYTQLSASVTDLRRLINDVKAQPRKYFKFSVF